MMTYPAGRAVSGASSLAELTTIEIGGPIEWLVEATSEDMILRAVTVADSEGKPLLALGGGSNILASDEPFAGIVVRDMRRGLTVSDAVSRDDEGREWVEVSAEAGLGWDEFVAATLDLGLSGLEALSGIPGTVGAAPVQNIGAYGHDVAATLTHLRAFDRHTATIVQLEASQLDFGYRTSALKRSIKEGWGPSPRWIVLSVAFRLERSRLSAPVAYGQLAARLGVSAGERAEAQAVREAVLALRASKGMVLDDADRDTYSCGSFYTNPVLSESEAANLPEDAPKFSAGSAEVGAAAPGEGIVKTSAAWLIDHAGFPAGYAMPGPAALSTKHCLALTNRGGATGAQMRALSDEIVAGVRERFGVELVPEPILLH